MTEMASSGNEDKKLLELFDEGFELFQCISHCDEPTNSLCIQNKVKQAMRMLEEATHLTSLAGVFSSNESVEEVATENLRLFLLPALLGTLALKLTVSNRIEVVETSDIYFRDFLQRCNDYRISNVQIPPPPTVESEEANKNPNARPMFDLVGAARTRASKIQKFKEEKALEEELNRLVKVVKSDCVDEDVKRDYYTKLIKSFVSQAEEEIDCLQAERRILAHMKSVKKEETASGNLENKRKFKPPPPKPLMPVIITRDEVQKAVFGAGYPSLPTMTVQEFYEKRVQDGIFPAKMDGAGFNMVKSDGGEEKEEREKAEKERLEEEDNPEELARQRAMDDFKDENKRGWGNRYNRS